MVTLQGFFLEQFVSASGLLLLVIGVTATLLSTNLVKRLVGLVFAVMGAMLAGLAFAGPSGALTAGIVIGLAYLMVGAFLLIRLQEAFGSLEARDIDAADAAAESSEAGP